MRPIDADALKKTFERWLEAKGYNEAERHIIRAAIIECQDAPTVQPDAPRVMTLEEVQQHYSLPPIFPDDFGMQEDYYEDIQPLYFDFPHDDDPWIVHWRRRSDVVEHLNEWAPYYGRKWRCWTGKPTKEQREAAEWDEAD